MSLLEESRIWEVTTDMLFPGDVTLAEVYLACVARRMRHENCSVIWYEGEPFLPRRCDDETVEPLTEWRCTSCKGTRLRPRTHTRWRAGVAPNYVPCEAAGWTLASSFASPQSH